MVNDLNEPKALRDALEGYKQLAARETQARVEAEQQTAQAVQQAAREAQARVDAEQRAAQATQARQAAEDRVAAGQAELERVVRVAAEVCRQRWAYAVWLDERAALQRCAGTCRMASYN